MSLHELLRHRPLTICEALFWDSIGKRQVHRATCSCGIEWMTDGGRWIGLKMRRPEIPERPWL